MLRSYCFVLTVFIGCVLALAAQAEEKFITIGTAGELGVYYPTGGAICRLVKRGLKEHGIQCFVEQTSGSAFNLKALRDKEVDLAIAQTDWVYNAFHGKKDFAASGADNDLRALFSLHKEAFTVLASADSGIKTLKDLAGKKIGVGTDGSGTLTMMEELLRAEGWTRKSFASVVELKASEQKNALCSGKVDALLFTSGHPNGATQEITKRCQTHLIPVEGPEIDALLAEFPYYLKVILPAGMYAGSSKPVASFGVNAVLVTSKAVDDETVYQVVKAVFDNLDNFKTLHPVFSSLNKEHMMHEGLIVPLHSGAQRYYKEAGLIKQ